jgi:hypothetical protein
MATNPYAVTADVTAFMQAGLAPVDPEATRLIARAQGAVDEYLIGVAYDVDLNGNPTDATGGVQAALKQAVCAQVEWWVVKGDDLDTDYQWTSIGVEGATLNRGALAPPKLAPRAITALRVAGLKSALFPIHMP